MACGGAAQAQALQAVSCGRSKPKGGRGAASAVLGVLRRALEEQQQRQESPPLAGVRRDAVNAACAFNCERLLLLAAAWELLQCLDAELSGKT